MLLRFAFFLSMFPIFNVLYASFPVDQDAESLIYQHKDPNPPLLVAIALSLFTILSLRLKILSTKKKRFWSIMFIILLSLLIIWFWMWYQISGGIDKGIGDLINGSLN